VTNPEIVTSVGLLGFRCVVGIVFLAHGYNHIFGGGKIAGTASWFTATASSSSGRVRVTSTYSP
jgi:uncharacterized membrane protein YphA (DoxX/SURF4 family)